MISETSPSRGSLILLETHSLISGLSRELLVSSVRMKVGAMELIRMS